MKTTFRSYRVVNDTPCMVETVIDRDKKRTNINFIPLTKIEDNIYCAYPKLPEETEIPHTDLKLIDDKVTYENGILQGDSKLLLSLKMKDEYLEEEKKEVERCLKYNPNGSEEDVNAVISKFREKRKDKTLSYIDYTIQELTEEKEIIKEYYETTSPL